MKLPLLVVMSVLAFAVWPAEPIALPPLWQPLCMGVILATLLRASALRKRLHVRVRTRSRSS